MFKEFERQIYIIEVKNVFLSLVGVRADQR